MLKSNATDLTSAILSAHLSSIAKKLVTAVDSFCSICLFSEDTVYKHHFVNDYIPTLYRKHTSEMNANCVFCMHLVKSGCHKQCLKCGIGKYQHCGPLLPGLLSCDSIYPYKGDDLKVPWYYTKTCSSFSRLPEMNYFKNLYVAFSSVSIYNYEILESLERGILSGEKPCHICASTDYEIYKKCYGQGDFHAFSPCHKIADELAEFYQNRNQDSVTNKEVS